MPVETLGLLDIADELVHALRGPHAHFDLSLEGRVARGAYTAPPAGAPFACLVPPRVGTREGRAMEVRDRTASFAVRAWVPFAQETQDDRFDQAVRQADELTAAIEDRYASRSALLHSCNQLTVAAAALDPVIADMAPAFAVAELVVEVRYRRLVGM